MAAGDPGPLTIIRPIGESALCRTERLHERVTALYQAHCGCIYRFLVAQGVSPVAAQEVTQDVFVKLFVALRNGVEILSEQGWLYAVAAKSAVDHWRREGTPVWVELDVSCANENFTSQDPSPETLAVRTEALQRVAD